MSWWVSMTYCVFTIPMRRRYSLAMSAINFSDSLAASSGAKFREICPTKFFSEGRLLACRLKLATMDSFDVRSTPSEAMIFAFLFLMSLA